MAGQTTQQQQQNQQSQSQPWAQAVPTLQNILNSLNGMGTAPTAGQTAAAGTLAGNAAAIPNLGAAGTGVINNLLSSSTTPQQQMLLSGYGNLQNELGATASGANVNPLTNPAIQGLLDTTRNDITNQVNGEFAAAGRDLSPANSQALARGISQGESGILTNQYNQNVANQMAAANQLYGAAGNTASGLAGLQQSAADQLKGWGSATRRRPSECSARSRASPWRPAWRR